MVDHSVGATDGSESRAKEEVEKHLLSYLMELEELRLVAKEIKGYLSAALNEQAIRFHLVEARAKSFNSYKKKSDKKCSDGSKKYTKLPHDIDDCVAARVIVFTENDQVQAVEEFRSRFQILEGEDRNPADERTDTLAPGWGYNSHHLVIGRTNDLLPETSNLGQYLSEGRTIEIQVRTVAAHAWAEYEHDVRYKPERLDRLSEKDQGMVYAFFKAAADDRIAMDQKFKDIENLLNRDTESIANPKQGTESQPVINNENKELNRDTLQELLIRLYPEDLSSSDSALDWMLRVLEAVEMTTTKQIDSILAEVNSEQVAALMEYVQPPSRIRRLDDELLAALGESYVSSTQEVADTDDLRKRRMRYLPARYARLNGKLRIYEVFDSKSEESVTVTAAGALRHLVQLLLLQDNDADVEVQGVISSSREEFRGRERTTLWEFEPNTLLWISANLSRSLAENSMKQIYERLEPGSVTVFRSGDPLFQKPHNTPR